VGFLEPLVANRGMRTSTGARSVLDDPMYLEATVTFPQTHVKDTLQCMPRAQPFKDSQDPVTESLDASIDYCATTAFISPPLSECMGSLPNGSILLAGADRLM
jgi:hypothetical protein